MKTEIDDQAFQRYGDRFRKRIHYGSSSISERIRSRSLANTLSKGVEIATDVLTQCAWRVGRQHSDQVATLAILRQMALLTDSIAVLTRQRCTDAARILLRPTLEASISLEYMLSSDTDRRSLSWVFCSLIDHIEQVSRIIPGTKEFNQLLDPLLSKLKLAKLGRSLLDRGNTIPNIEDLIREEPEMAPIAKEYDRVSAQRKGRISWYQLFGGPTNFWEMSRLLKRDATYGIGYRSWSSSLHGTKYGAFLSPSSRETLKLHPIRTIDGAISVAANATQLILSASTQMVESYLSSRLKQYQRRCTAVSRRMVKMLTHSDDPGAKLLMELYNRTSKTRTRMSDPEA